MDKALSGRLGSAAPADDPAAEAVAYDEPDVQRAGSSDRQSIAHGRLSYLDGWRGFSVLFVLIGHFLPISPINCGRLGVEMFFVLSGRLMAEILFVRETYLPDFFRRRISRVWPALFVFVGVILFLFGRAVGANHVSALQALAAATFTLNYANLAIGRTEILDHIWSLCVEEHMYVILAGIALLARRRGVDPFRVCAALALVLIVNGAIQTAFGGDYFSVYWRTDTRGASILIAVATYLYCRRRDLGQGAPSLWPLVLALAGVVLNVNRVPDPIKYSLGTLCLAIAVCTLGSLPGWALRIARNPLIVGLGTISYSVYLWQQPLAKLTGSGLPALLLCAVAIVAGAASYAVIEQPVRRYLNARWQSRARAHSIV